MSYTFRPCQREKQRRLPLVKTGTLPPPLTRDQRVDNAKRLIEIHEIAYGNTTDGRAERLPAILEADQEHLARLTGRSTSREGQDDE